MKVKEREKVGALNERRGVGGAGVLVWHLFPRVKTTWPLPRYVSALPLAYP